MEELEQEITMPFETTRYQKKTTETKYETNNQRQ